MPFQNFAAFGTDQLNAQRMFCCGSAEGRAQGDGLEQRLAGHHAADAGGRVRACSPGIRSKGLTPDEAAKFAENPNFVFPVWITTVLPPGLTGLILAGAFAAAISSLDSVLAALSQTSLSAMVRPRETRTEDEHGTAMVGARASMVVVWAAVLSRFAILLAGGYAKARTRT